MQDKGHDSESLISGFMPNFLTKNFKYNYGPWQTSIGTACNAPFFTCLFSKNTQANCDH